MIGKPKALNQRFVKGAAAMLNKYYGAVFC